MTFLNVILNVVKNLSRMRVFSSDIRQRFLVALLLGMTIVSPVYAVDSTPSADIKSKLEALTKEIASKAARLKQEIDRKLQDKAYVGKLKTKSLSSLTLATRSGPKIVSLNQDTVFESNVKTRKNLSQKTIAEEDYLAALGDIDETAVLTAKKIVLLSTVNSEQHTAPSGLKTYLWGQIISISGKLVTLRDKDLKNVAVSLPADSKVKLNDFVILTGNKNKNDIFEAGFEFIIPQGGIIRLKKVATPSASLKPTPSPKTATPSAKSTTRKGT